MLESDLIEIVGRQGFVQGSEVAQRVGMQPYACESTLLIRPATTEQLSAIMALCHETGQTVVVHGGRSGLAGGCSASAADIVISLERLNFIDPVDVPGRTVTVGAGAIIQDVQQAARTSGLSFCVDWGGRGSATVGGAISTNAGGHQVLRYGMMREQVLGLEVVLADGTIISSMTEVLKNNAGYDLKQLFIGSEGTLGIVTRAVLRLRPLLPARATALIAVDGFDALPELLNRLEIAMDGRLTSFEVMWRSFYKGAASAVPVAPFDREHPYVVLAEASGSSESELTERMTGLLADAMSAGIVADALVARSERDRAGWWAIRDNFRGLASLAPFAAFDISLPVAEMPDYLRTVEMRLVRRLGHAAMAVFGHLGDQNLHLIIGYGDGGPSAKALVEQVVYKALEGRRGSMSAEHGIGTAKSPWLGATRSAAELDVMRRLKSCFDPAGILNPGRVLGPSSRWSGKEPFA